MMSHLNFFMISENELYVIYGNISNLLFLLFAIQLHEIFDPNFKWVLFTFVKNDSAKLVQHTCAAWIRDLLTQLFLDNSVSSRQNKIYYQIFANVHQQTCDL